jgi:hypothetical protein
LIGGTILSMGMIDDAFQQLMSALKAEQSALKDLQASGDDDSQLVAKLADATGIRREAMETWEAVAIATGHR